jgi:hypothetical protein
MRGLPTELELFSWLKRHYYYDLRSHAGAYNFYDAWSLEFRFYAELKVRHHHYDELLIEKAKHDRIVKIAGDNRAEALYIVATPQGVWQYEIATLGIRWQDMTGLPATTQFTNTERITKRVGLLPIKAATRLGEARSSRRGGVIYADR